KDAVLQNHSTWNTLTVNSDITNNGIIKDTDGNLSIRVSGNIFNNGTWDNYRTTLTFPSGEFKMTGTENAWPDPIRTGSYDITPYLNTVHHWWAREEGGEWSEKRGINDPSLITQFIEGSNTPPTAIFAISQTQGKAPFKTTLDGSGSFDPDGSIVEYEWSINHNPVLGVATYDQLFGKQGEYTITLTVKDNNGLMATSAPQTVVVTEPEATGPKMCEDSKPSNTPASFDIGTNQLTLPQIRVGTRRGHVYAMTLTLQSSSASHLGFKLTDYCLFNNPLAIVDGENTARLNPTQGILHIPAVVAGELTLYANLYLDPQPTELVTETDIFTQDKPPLFRAPLIEVIFGQTESIPVRDVLSPLVQMEVIADLFGEKVRAVLIRFDNPDNPTGIYWKLTFFERSVSGIAEVVVQENSDLLFNNKQIAGQNYTFTLQSYHNPNDQRGLYWQYVDCPDLQKRYPSPGLFFPIENASCRQKADMHLFMTVVSPQLMQLSKTFSNKLDATVTTNKIIQSTLTLVDGIYSAASDIETLQEKGVDKFIEGKLQGEIEGGLIEGTVKIVFGNNDLADGLSHGIQQVVKAIKSCNPKTGKLDGCDELAVDLFTDVVGTISNFVGSLFLYFDTKRLKSVICTETYLLKYYGFGGNSIELAKSVGLSPEASRSEVLKKIDPSTSICNNSNMSYTNSLIDRYQHLISVTNPLNQ
ncbi:MAG: hypothetical protein DRR19_31840, partial [Candidatus Parabeggiatoa sp. nov. 1]